MVGVVFGALKFLPDGGGGDDPPKRAKQEGGWLLKKDNEPLVIRPPSSEGDPFADCAGAPSTFVDLDDLTVTTDSNHGNIDGDSQTLEYMNCGKDGSVPGSGLKLKDGQGIWGKVDKRDISPGDCKDAAREANVPNPVSIKQIQSDSVLKKGGGLCVETGAKNVVLLWITRVDAHPDNHDLRTFVISATQWSPKSP